MPRDDATDFSRFSRGDRSSEQCGSAAAGAGWGFKDDAGAETEEAPRPLFRPPPPALDFPARALGPLRDAAEAVQALTQAPIALCAQSVLAAVTLVVQAHRDVQLPGGGRKPLTGLFVSVADSGERKTSVDKLALTPVHRVEAQWREDNRGALNRYRADLAGWKEAAEAIKKKARATARWSATDCSTLARSLSRRRIRCCWSPTRRLRRWCCIWPKAGRGAVCSRPKAAS
jgi:hypothetical protein